MVCFLTKMKVLKGQTKFYLRPYTCLSMHCGAIVSVCVCVEGKCRPSQILSESIDMRMLFSVLHS